MTLKLKLILTFLILIIIVQAIGLCVIFFGSQISKGMTQRHFYSEIRYLKSQVIKLQTENLLFHFDRGQVKLKTEFSELEELTLEQKQALRSIIFVNKEFSEPEKNFDKCKCIAYNTEVHIIDGGFSGVMYIEKCCNSGLRYEDLLLPFSDSDFINFVQLVGQTILSKIDSKSDLYLRQIEILNSLKEIRKK